MKYKLIFLLICCLILGAVLRFYQLGVIPPSLDWDEVSLGWNSYSLLKTGSDEFGQRFPISALRSFNDYKAPLYVYADLPAMAFFGLSEWSTRLPSALIGSLTVVLTYLLVKELSHRTKLSLLAAFLAAVSPWSLLFSRVAFEANLGQGLFLAGVTCLVFFLRRNNTVYLILGTLIFTSSLYAYHSNKIVVPIFLLGVIMVYSSNFKRSWKAAGVSLLLAAVMLFPLVKNSFLPNSPASSRLGAVSILNSPNSSKIFVNNYLNQFSPNFLFITGDKNPRHGAPDMGLLYLVELPLIIAGLYFLISTKFSGRFLILWWLLAAPLGAALTKESPHAVRSLIILPTFQIIAALGLWALSQRSKPHFKVFFAGIMAILFFINSFYFFHQYFIHLPIENAPAWQYGYKQMVQKIIRMAAIERKTYGYSEAFPKVYITKAYDQPYIYFLFYGGDPADKNTGNFSDQYKNFYFEDFSKIKRDLNPEGLYVTAPSDIVPLKRIIETINFPNGQVAFKIGIL